MTQLAIDLPPARPQWRRAFAALRELLRSPDRTELAFEIAQALDPNAAERALLRMLAHPEGRRVYEARPSLRERLADRELLARLPEDSYGRAYLAHLELHGLDPVKLIELGRDVGGEAVSPEPGIRWVSERSELAHDLWHVLSGYGADELGESALLAFSLAQTGGRSNALLTAGAGLRTLALVGPRWIPYLWRAWRRGRRAVCLAALPHEELLALPLAEVRQATGIEPPERAHPRGILRGNPIRSAR